MSIKQEEHEEPYFQPNLNMIEITTEKVFISQTFNRKLLNHCPQSHFKAFHNPNNQLVN